MNKTPAFGLREITALIGLGCLAAGLGLQSVPLALTVVGALLFGLAVWPLLWPRRGEK